MMGNDPPLLMPPSGKSDESVEILASVQAQAIQVYKPVNKAEVRVVYRIKQCKDPFLTNTRHQKSYSFNKYGEAEAYSLARHAYEHINQSGQLPSDFAIPSGGATARGRKKTGGSSSSGGTSRPSMPTSVAMSYSPARPQSSMSTSNYNSIPPVVLTLPATAIAVGCVTEYMHPQCMGMPLGQGTQRMHDVYITPLPMDGRTQAGYGMGAGSAGWSSNSMHMDPSQQRMYYDPKTWRSGGDGGEGTPLPTSGGMAGPDSSPEFSMKRAHPDRRRSMRSTWDPNDPMGRMNKIGRMGGLDEDESDGDGDDDDDDDDDDDRRRDRRRPRHRRHRHRENGLMDPLKHDDSLAAAGYGGAPYMDAFYQKLNAGPPTEHPLTGQSDGMKGDMGPPGGGSDPSQDAYSYF